MLITTHTLVGAALGRAIGAASPRPSAARLGLAAAAGVASHFLCDALPHWGTAGVPVRSNAFLRVAVPDGLTGLALLAWSVRRAPAGRHAVVAAATLGACLPDADKVGTFILGRSPFPGWLDRWHGRIQRESPDRLPADLAVAGVLAALSLP